MFSALVRSSARPAPTAERPWRSKLQARQQGLALIVVVWTIAALMVTATGVVYAVREEVRMVSSFRESAVAGALADGAIFIAASELARARDRESRLMLFETTVENTVVDVRAVPLSGLIDLNAASEFLLTDLIAVAGGIERASATVLAQRIIDWRDADEQTHPSGAENAEYSAAGSPFRPRNGPFESPEDLLQVLGVDYELYVKLRRLLTVHQRGGGRVDPVAAPYDVLRVLASGDEQLASAYASARDATGTLADSTRFPAAYIAPSRSSRFLIEASVRLSNGAFLVCRRIVDLGSGQAGSPWQTLWSERVVEAAG